MTMPDLIKSRIMDEASLQKNLHLWRFKNKKIVFTNGCFDLLHLGHVDYLSKAADLGDILIIGINSDESVRHLKGPNRPINDQVCRSTVLAALHFVEAIFIFKEETPYELIKIIQPDVLVKGGDYEPANIVGYDIVKAKGGQIITIDLVPNYSSTLIEQKIKSTR